MDSVSINNTECSEESHFLHANYMSRLKFPVVWLRTGTGIKIEDLTENDFYEVIQILQEYYIRNEALYKTCCIADDKDSIQWYIDRLLDNLENKSSLIAVDETQYSSDNEDDIHNEKNPFKRTIAGILISRIIKNTDYGRVVSREDLTQGNAIKKCVKLRFCLNARVDLYAKYKCQNIMRIYDVCILPKYRHMGLADNLIRSSLLLARHKGSSAVMGIFSNYRLQRIVQKIGFQTLDYINYNDWKDKAGNIIFRNIAAGNLNCALMARLLPTPMPFPKSPIIEEIVLVKDKKSKK